MNQQIYDLIIDYLKFSFPVKKLRYQNAFRRTIIINNKAYHLNTANKKVILDILSKECESIFGLTSNENKPIIDYLNIHFPTTVFF